MIIDIFGDSFSDDNIRHQNTDTWTDILRKDFEIRNFSKDGTGAQWSVEEFMKLDDHGDYLLFCFADMNRVAFEYMEDQDQAHALLVYNLMKENNDFEFPDTINETVINKSDRIFKDFESFYSTGLYRTLEVLLVSYILSKSKYYKKILIWPSSGLGFPFRFYSNKIEIPGNCYIIPKSMHMISQLEGSYKMEKSNTFTFGKDHRNNHLSYENHVIFAKQVTDFFVSNVRPNYEDFKLACGP